MTINFWWVRHAPTHAKTFIGHTDIPADLSDTGALERLDQYLPKTAEILSSDLLRSVTTADAIANSRTRRPHSAALREMDFGDWEGGDFAKTAAKYPELSKEFWENPGNISPPDGESWNVFSSRVHKEINRIVAHSPPKDIIIVAHFGTILAALQKASGMPSSSVFSFKIGNLSVTKISYLGDENSWAVQYVNQNT